MLNPDAPSLESHTQVAGFAFFHPPSSLSMLRGCSSRSLTLLSRVLGGQGTGQSPALVAGRQHFRTSIKHPSAQQAIASADGRVCQQQQQQLWKLARQVTCSATAAATLPVGQSMENIMVRAVLDRSLALFCCLAKRA